MNAYDSRQVEEPDYVQQVSGLSTVASFCRESLQWLSSTVLHLLLIALHNAYYLLLTVGVFSCLRTALRKIEK